MEYAIIAAIVLVTGGWVFYPLLRPQHVESSGLPDSDDQVKALQHRKENVYATIKEMDFDYQMGKLSEADYAHLKAQYTGKAIEILQSLDALDQADDAELEAAIELEVRQLCEQHQPGIEAAKDDKTQMLVNFCPHCGVTVLPHSNFCHDCGFNLTMPVTEEPV